MDYKKILKRHYPNIKEIAFRHYRAVYIYDYNGEEIDKVYSGSESFPELYRRLYNKVKNLLK